MKAQSTGVFLYIREMYKIHGESIAASCFCSSQSFGLYLHAYCRLGLRVLCLVPVFGEGKKEFSVFEGWQI